MAGKLVLLKATLDSLPLYWFNFFIIPKGIKKHIDTIRRNFLWGNKKIRLASWNLVTCSKNSGGLGVTDLEHRNLAMMSKNWWNIKENKNSIWRRLLNSKYGTDYNNWTNIQGGRHNLVFITNMRYLRSHNATGTLFNNNNYTWRAYIGDIILFWEDVWTKEHSLANIYPRLYRISKYKQLYIRDMLNVWENINSTQELWSRPLYNQEENEAQEIYNIIQGYNANAREDILYWKKNKDFIVSEMYHHINSQNNTNSYRWAFIWTLKVLPKIKTFMWKICNNLIPT